VIGDDETLPIRLEEALRGAPELRGRKVRVINGAVPGYSSVQGVRLFEKLAALEPDVVVFWFGINDAGRMRGLPDSELTYHGAHLSGVVEFLSNLRVFQFMRGTATNLRQAGTEGTRVSRAEFEEAVRGFLALQEQGGPQTIFVREPHRLGTTREQLARVVAQADKARVEVVYGPHRLLSWVVPAPPGADLEGQRVSVPLENGKTVSGLLFPADASLAPGYEEVNHGRTVEELRADLQMLSDLERNLDRLLDTLPKGSLTFEDLFGSRTPEQVFTDNCHLSPYGARIAGRRLAERILEILADREQ
jgi:lysophospholipase L1-like esterase